MKILHIILLANLILLSGTLSAQFKIEPLPVQASLIKEGKSQFLDGPSILKLKDYFIWGGSVIQGKDHKYHMVFSLWESGQDKPNFGTNWVLESMLGYAVSEYPDKEFEFKKIILKGARHDGDNKAWDAQMVHNPHLKEFNGKYYLYYIGASDPGQKVAPDLNKRARVQQSLKIGVLSFKSFDKLLQGDFKRPQKPALTPRSRVKANQVLNPSPKGTPTKPDNLIAVNPSVAYNHKSREYMLFFKGNVYEPHWKGVHGVATGPSPEGPFTAKDDFIFDVRMPNGKLASAEDPYVWYAPKYDCFFAIVKDFTGAFTNASKKSLAMLKSADGIHWEITSQSLFMKRELTLEDGTKIQLDRLERPQLLVNAEGVPMYLYCAAAVLPLNSKKDGSSFNVQVPLQVILED